MRPFQTVFGDVPKIQPRRSHPFPSSFDFETNNHFTNFENKNSNSSKSYIYFGQANLMKSPNATSELGLWINSVMSNFKYQDSDRAGILINRKPEMDDLYIQRLKNVGVIVNDHDEVIKRPKREELYKYKASYRKKTEALSLLNK